MASSRASSPPSCEHEARRVDFGSPHEAFLRGRACVPTSQQLLYTSGTTGESKGVLHTSNTLLGRSQRCRLTCISTRAT